MSFPLIISPFTDLDNMMFPVGVFPRTNKFCRKIQARYGDCMEAYGLRKGVDKCTDLMYDLHECTRGTFQIKRYQHIQEQRRKLYKQGKLDTLNAENPPPDAYLNL